MKAVSEDLNEIISTTAMSVDLGEGLLCFLSENLHLEGLSIGLLFDVILGEEGKLLTGASYMGI